MKFAVIVVDMLKDTMIASTHRFMKDFATSSRHPNLAGGEKLGGLIVYANDSYCGRISFSGRWHTAIRGRGRK